MPDSFRDNPFGDRQGLDLGPAEMDGLIAKGEMEMPQGHQWRLQFVDSTRSHLRVTRERSEEALRYELLNLGGSKSATWVLVLQGLEDHCCSFGRWALYQVKKGILLDQTKARMPRLDWTDFFTAAQLGDSRPASPKANRYPFSMQVQARPAQISVGVVADYLNLNFPEEQAASLLAHLPDSPRKLIWQDQHFVWASE